jgi:hypothetical protein
VGTYLVEEAGAGIDFASTEMIVAYHSTTIQLFSGCQFTVQEHSAGNRRDGRGEDVAQSESSSRLLGPEGRMAQGATMNPGHHLAAVIGHPGRVDAGRPEPVVDDLDAD